MKIPIMIAIRISTSIISSYLVFYLVKDEKYSLYIYYLQYSTRSSLYNIMITVDFLELTTKKIRKKLANAKFFCKWYIWSDWSRKLFLLFRSLIRKFFIENFSNLRNIVRSHSAAPTVPNKNLLSQLKSNLHMLKTD